jgi:hypothetical protein
LAQPPDINETFVREVDEDLRRDQMRDFFKTYGMWVMAAVALGFIAFAIYGAAQRALP